MVQYFMLAAVVTVLILAALTLNNVTKIKQETVPSLQSGNANLDVALTVGQTTTSEVTFVQPANSRIDSILVIPLAAVKGTSTGTIGYKVGSTTGGVDVVAAVADGVAAASSAAVALTPVTSTVVAALKYTNVARTMYFDVTNSSAVTVAGSVRFIVSYTQF